MEEDTLTNILNILQNTNNTTNSGSNANNNPNQGSTNDILQSLLLKMFLSGGLNNFFTPSAKKTEPTPEPPAPRTINLENYKRLD